MPPPGRVPGAAERQEGTCVTIAHAVLAGAPLHGLAAGETMLIAVAIYAGSTGRLSLARVLAAAISGARMLPTARQGQAAAMAVVPVLAAAAASGYRVRS